MAKARKAKRTPEPYTLTLTGPDDAQVEIGLTAAEARLIKRELGNACHDFMTGTLYQAFAEIIPSRYTASFIVDNLEGKDEPAATEVVVKALQKAGFKAKVDWSDADDDDDF
jgi:hypothetical protein